MAPYVFESLGVDWWGTLRPGAAGVGGTLVHLRGAAEKAMLARQIGRGKRDKILIVTEVCLMFTMHSLSTVKF
jgi:hypothetical protein